MRKDQLVKALVKLAKSKSKQSSRNSKRSRPSKASAASAKPGASNRNSSRSKSRVASATNGKSRQTGGATSRKTSKSATPAALRKIRAAQARRDELKDLAADQVNGHSKGKNGVARDRVVLMVRDPYWLHAHWELTRQSVERAQAAMAEHWHTARPVLRLLQLEKPGTTNTTEKLVRDIPIHGGVRNWYIDVLDPPKHYRVEIGYLSNEGRFHSLGRSNAVTTPRPGTSEAVDENWTDVAENCEKIYAMSGGYNAESSNQELQDLFEERLRRPMGSPMETSYGMGAQGVLDRTSELPFEVDAEMVVYGVTRPSAYVTLAGEPIKLRPDGTFSVRMSLPNRRQVIPVVASAASGVEQRTIVLAVERNTKVMEPVIRDPNE